MMTLYDAVSYAYDKGYFTVEDGDNYGCYGIHCETYDNGFYCFGSEAEDFETAEEYINSVGVESICQSITDTIKAFIEDDSFPEEALGYLLDMSSILPKEYHEVLNEWIDKARETIENEEMFYKNDLSVKKNLTEKQIEEIKEEYDIEDLIKDAKECQRLMTSVKTVDDLLNLVEQNYLESELDQQPIKLCNGDVYYGFGELLNKNVDINESVDSFTLEAFGDIEFPSVSGLNDKPIFTFDIYPKEYDPDNEIARDVSIEDIKAILDDKKMETLKRTDKEQGKGKEDR